MRRHISLLGSHKTLIYPCCSDRGTYYTVSSRRVSVRYIGGAKRFYVCTREYLCFVTLWCSSSTRIKTYHPRAHKIARARWRKCAKNKQTHPGRNLPLFPKPLLTGRQGKGQIRSPPHWKIYFPTSTMTAFLSVSNWVQTWNFQVYSEREVLILCRTVLNRCRQTWKCVGGMGYSVPRRAAFF